MTRRESRPLLVTLRPAAVWRGLLAAALLLTAISGCSQTGSTTVTLGASDSGRSVALKVGDTLTIELEGNPTTGFSWEVDSVDEAVLEPVGEGEYSASETGLVGSGGVFAFTFKAARKGQTQLRLVYHRSWEGVAPADTFELDVVVS